MRDGLKKQFLEELPITLFCIHANHEQRPGTIDTYMKMIWYGGSVYYEEEYPHLLFAKDGKVFDFDGKKTIVIGGAYSVDKEVRLMYGYGWWPGMNSLRRLRRMWNGSWISWTGRWVWC